jgi:hypothetical protein
MQIIAFSQSDHSLGKRPDRLSFCESSPDPAVLNEAADLVGEQQIPVLGFPAKLNRLLRVSHIELERDELAVIVSVHIRGRLDQPRIELHP